jgi:hypothetical protein
MGSHGYPFFLPKKDLPISVDQKQCPQALIDVLFGLNSHFGGSQYTKRKYP